MDRLSEVNAAYATQNREWRQLQARAGHWLEGAEQTYAAVAGLAGASALDLTGSAALELPTVTRAPAPGGGPRRGSRGCDSIVRPQ